MSARVLVLAGLGLNTDLEFQLGFEMVGASTQRCHVNELLNGKTLLEDYDILVIPGGFSFGDHISAGRVLANKLRIHFRDRLKIFVDQGGYILGTCNGWQILLKSGLLPGGNFQTCTLTYNDSGRFEDRWVKLKIENSVSKFTQGIKQDLYLPIRCGEGKFVTIPNTLEYLKDNNLIALRYIDSDPTGSMEAIAGICDPTGRILGLMPHPEAYLTPYHHPHWTRKKDIGKPDGLKILENIVSYINR